MFLFKSSLKTCTDLIISEMLLRCLALRIIKLSFKRTFYFNKT